MIDQITGNRTVIYDGSQNPNLLEFNAANLFTGRAYGFQVQAYNFNGKGSLSSNAIYKACTAPSGQATPKVTYVDATTISLSWLPPTNNGSCPIKSYTVYFDDGSSGPFVASAVSDLQNKPYLTSYTFTFLASQTGLTFRYMISA